MPAARSNQEWIQALSRMDDHQSEALLELRDLLLRAVLYTLVIHRNDLQEMNEHERMALAEDCAQDALQAVLTHLPDFRGKSKFTTWAYKFGVHTALTRARRERWKNISLDALSEADDPLDWIQWKEGLQTGDSEMPSMQAEVRALIQDVVRSKLTDRQRQVLNWIVFDEVPMDVVVERLKTNRNAIYKLLHDGRIKIKRQLAAHGYDVEEVYELFRLV